MKPARKLTAIARKHLGIPTLEVRRSDALDFHEVAVWSVADALHAAFQAGKQSCDPDPALPHADGRSQQEDKATNASRATRISNILSSLKGNDDEHTCLVDLLADAMHWCDHTGGDFHLALAQACRHYIHELNDQPTDERRL